MATKFHALPVLISKLGNVTTISLVCAIVDPKRMTFTVSAAYVEASVPHIGVLATDSGKTAKFSDIDGIVKSFAKAMPGVEVINVESNVAVLSPETLTYDIAALNARELTRYQGKLTGQTAMVAGITAKLALIASWQSGTALQMAAWTKLNGELTSATEYKTWLAAKVDELNGP